MKLGLSNINKIRQADINLNGLTVIAGTNDSGKSTIGKILFSIIKALDNCKDNSRLIDDTIGKKLRSLYTNLSQFDDLYHTSLKSIIFSISYRNVLRELRDKNTKNSVLSRLSRLKGQLEQTDIKPFHRAVVNNLVSEIQELATEEAAPNGILKREMQAILEAEFVNSVCTHHTSSSRIFFSDESGNENLQVTIQDNLIKEIEGGTGCFLEDVTLVESPLYLHLIDILSTARTFNELKSMDKRLLGIRPLVNYHIKDMAEKLASFKYVGMHTLFQESTDSDEINHITGGYFSFDEDNNNIYWIKGEEKYQVVNVASGIKSFGVMQILKAVNAINERKVLIWDEPENHLHPEWQIRLAALLMEQAKAGVPVLLTSHSPYFIQAIRYFADKMHMNSFVSYYMTDEQKDGTCVLSDCTDDLNKIFFKLAQPLNDIINLGL